MATSSGPKAPKRPTVSLALQGGGSHGAFQWGVLDRLLEHDGLDIRVITAASAGALNGAALITGWAQGGAVAARQALDTLWREINQQGGRNVFGDFGSLGAALTPDWLKDTHLWRAGEAMASSFSPYQFNPLNLNPLQRAIETAVDFDAVRGSDVRFIVAATRVRQGRVRLFETPDITLDSLLASACLPHLFQAVEIDGEPYWDGGYLANPALWPLIQEGMPDDILILPLNPFTRDDTPRTAGEIMDRLNEINFNAPLIAELRALALMQELIADKRLKPTAGGHLQDLRVHAIASDPWLGDMPLSSKVETEWSYLIKLRDRGRHAAEDWLAQCADAVGVRSSVDLRDRFL